jgi:protein gp37
MDRHAFCDLFPRMDAEQFGRLKASIKAHGFDPRFPILTFEGKILDGANRWRACRELDIKPVVEPYEGSDPLGFVIAANLTRRHLDESQRAMVAAKIANMRQGARTDLQPQTNLSEVSLDGAAKKMDVSAGSVKAARVVLDHGAPELVRAVEEGRVAVSAAKALARLSAKEQAVIALERDERQRRAKVKAGVRKARALPKAEKAQKAEPLVLAPGIAKGAATGPFSVESWKKLTAAEREKVIAAGFEHATGKLNEQTGDSIEWARFSHNCVTGCLHDCPYCYARDTAERQYPQGFAPTFHPVRLAGPSRVKVPAAAATDASYRNIFANSMSDLFGRWVPEDWIGAAIEMARRNPRWNFLTLTKFPQRAAEFEFPKNWWMGTTVDVQARVANAERAFEKIRCETKWLSVEPLLEPLTFKRLDLFQWVVIGGASASTKTPAWVPPFDWVSDLQRAARDAGCRIYHKTNLDMGDRIRVREFPWVKVKERELPKTLRYTKGLE